MSLLRLARPCASISPLLRRSFSTTRFLLDQPTVLSTLQPELKSAMRAKDKPRLAVLRSLLAEITNASKTPKPIASDAALYSLLSKQIKASQAAIQEFEAAKRDDLVEKERGQIDILEGYAGKIDVVGEDEVRSLAKEVKEAIGGEARAGPVMGKVMGKLSGRPVDMELVKKVVEEALA